MQIIMDRPKHFRGTRQQVCFPLFLTVPCEVNECDKVIFKSLKSYFIQFYDILKLINIKQIIKHLIHI